MFFIYLKLFSPSQINLKNEDFQNSTKKQEMT